MKTLSEQDLKPDDSLWFDFIGAMDPQALRESELEPFLQGLEEYADGWMPNVVNGKRNRKYSRLSFWKALDEGRDGNSTTLGLYRTAWPALDGYLGLRHPPRPPQLDIRIQVKPLSFFAEAERCRKFVEMVRTWASHYPVNHAKAHSSDDLNLAGAPSFGRDDETRRRDGFDKIYEVCWLNVFGQPPEPEEWAPATSALPSDVDDPAAAREHYDTLAEHLVALLHTQVPSVFEATPESLTDADFYFWHEDFPTRRLPEAIERYAIPAVGAYLGEVLVRGLGGQWIPRQKLEEAQVLVGSRVWFPFVRARHYLRSRQSLLDCSLTRLYRVAERHRS